MEVSKSREEQTCTGYISSWFYTFLLHHFQSLQGLSVKVLQILGPAGLNEHILLEQRGCRGLFIVIFL